MLNDFDLLISSARGNETEANSEIRYILGELGDHNSITNRTEVSGLTVAKTSLEPISIVWNLRSLLRSKPWEFRYVLKIKPIEHVVESRILNIQSAVNSLVDKIQPNETFRVTIEKRKSNLSSSEIIDNVAQGIPRQVNLNAPDKIILIEILASFTGIAIISPNDIFSVEKEKRGYPSTATKAVRSTNKRFNASTLSSPNMLPATNFFSVIP